MNAHQRRVARRRSRNHKFGPLMTLTAAEIATLRLQLRGIP